MKESTALPEITSLEELIKEYGPASELVKDIDYAMLYMVHLLRYEPENAAYILAPYETLRGLRNLIQTYSPLKP